LLNVLFLGLGGIEFFPATHPAHAAFCNQLKYRKNYPLRQTNREKCALLSNSDGGSRDETLKNGGLLNNFAAFFITTNIKTPLSKALVPSDAHSRPRFQPKKRLSQTPLGGPRPP